MSILVTTAPPETVPTLAFARPGSGSQADPWTATVDSFGNSLRSVAGVMKGRLVPPLYSDNLTIDAVAGNVLTCSGLHQFETRPAAFYLGASLLVLRDVAGKITEIGQTTVTDCTIKRVYSLLGAKQAVAAGQSQVVWSPPNYHKPGDTVYFALASVDSSGNRSPWSQVVSYVTASPPAAVENTSVKINTTEFNKRVESGALPVPQSVAAVAINADQSVRITWTPLPDYAVIIARAGHPDMVNLETITVADTDMIQADDVVVCQKRFDHTTTRAQAVAPRVWKSNPSLTGFGISGIGTFNEDMPAGVSFAYVNESDRDFVRLTIADGVTFTITAYTHQHINQDFYTTLAPGTTYKVRAVAKADRSVGVELGMSGADVTPQSGAIGTAWGQVEASFTSATTATDGGVRPSTMKVTGPVTLDLQHFFVFDGAAEPYAATPDMEGLLVDSGAGFIRMHSTCKTRPWSYSMRDVLSNYGTRATDGTSFYSMFNILGGARVTRGEIGLPKRLNPWIQLEPFVTDADLALLAGYMCTPYDPAVDTPESKPGAYLRYSQGQKIPWQIIFDTIMLEVGNENWNSIPDFYTLPGMNGRAPGWVNGKMLDRYAEALMAADGYDAAKWKFYLGGHVNGPGWNNDSIAASAHADYFGFANYNGGWDSGLSAALQADDPQAMFYTLANSNVPNKNGQTRGEATSALVAMLAAASQGRAKPIRAMHYEAGPGYVLNGLNGASVTPEEAASQELLMKSVASGTATLDAFLTNAAAGMVSNNFFTINAGTNWTAQAMPHKGGAYNPPFQWFCFMNEYLVGDVRKITPDIQPALFAPDGTRAGNPVKVYEVKRPGGTVAYALCNVDPVNAQQVKLKVPAGSTWTRHYMTGTAKTHNTTSETATAVDILQEVMPATFDDEGMLVTIPAGKAEVYAAA